ncbi:MAG: CoA-binding protein, partial [Saccharofermentanales bacterium]
PNISNLEKFFAPEGIAVFGVSSDISKYSMAKVIVSLFLELGRDDIYCVNPKGGSAAISGHEFKLYKDFSEIPGTVDLIVYAAPAKNTLLFLDSIPEDKAIVLISGMPPEIDYGGFLIAVAERKRGIRLIGPNCMGVYNAPSGDMKGVNTLFIDERKLRISYSDRSNTALATQSGAMGITMIERNQYSAILRTIVSFGNKADVDIPDLLAYLLARDDIDVVSLYIEGLNELEGRQFYELAASSDKPVIVYKSGRTEAGAKAAASHTASMSGSYDVFKAACEQAGCILTEELDDFYNLTKVFAMLSSRIVRGQRVAGVVNAGLDATMGADTIYFLQQAVLDKITIERISALNKQGLVDIGTSFLDVTPMTDDKAFAEYVRAVLADDNVDCMFIAIVPHIENLKTSEEDYMDPDAIAVLLSDISKKTDKPVVISVNAGSHYQNLVSYFEVNGIPVFPDIHAAIRSLDRFVRCRIQ